MDSLPVSLPAAPGHGQSQSHSHSPLPPDPEAGTPNTPTVLGVGMKKRKLSADSLCGSRSSSRNGSAKASEGDTSGESDAIPSPVAAPSNVLKACFAGELCSTLTCGSCGHTSSKDEHFVDLSLSLRQRQSTRNTADVLRIADNSTLLGCLRDHHSAESLADPVLCSSCGLREVSEKQLSVKVAPGTLFIQLKRFNALLQKKVSLPSPP